MFTSSRGSRRKGYATCLAVPVRILTDDGVVEVIALRQQYERILEIAVTSRSSFVGVFCEVT